MGQCIGREQQRQSSRSNRTVSPVKKKHSSKADCNIEKLNRNLHLQPVEGSWTTSALKEQRKQFWETAPAYEGQTEIWQALKAAVDAIQNTDYELADIIVKAAGVTSLDGTLQKCYDELGTLYQIPNYVVADPKTLTSDEKQSKKDSFRNTKVSDVELTIRPMNFNADKDVKITVDSDITVRDAKLMLVPNLKKQGVTSQIWFCAGKVLEDEFIVAEKIPKGFIIQAKINYA